MKPLPLPEPDRLVRLRAEMKLPGEAWIQWELVGQDDGGTRLDQQAIFYPRGLLGRLYWYALVPFHGLIFARMAARIARAAEDRPADAAPRSEAQRGW